MITICCMVNECILFHVYNWIQFFVSMYNDTIANNIYDFGLKEMNIIYKLTVPP